jgi:hypothetical protein
MALATRTYSDLDLNFTAHPITKDVVKRTGYSAIIGAVRNLVLTNPFEKPFQPTYGSGVRGLLFEDVSFITANLLQSELQDTIQAFEPRVTVKAVRVQADDVNNGYKVTIVFYTNNAEAPVTINMFLEKVR